MTIFQFLLPQFYVVDNSVLKESAASQMYQVIFFSKNETRPCLLTYEWRKKPVVKYGKSIVKCQTHYPARCLASLECQNGPISKHMNIEQREKKLNRLGYGVALVSTS